MEKQSEHLETLSEIRSMMERSSRFISLNGLSGVFAGIFALLGAGAAFLFLHKEMNPSVHNGFYSCFGGIAPVFYIFFFTDAVLVLFASLAVATYLSIRKAHKKGLKIWDHTTKRVLFNMLIPLSAGGIFCLILLFHGQVELVAPVTLIFYGLALLNTSKYTYDEIRFLGIIEMVLGLMASLWIGFGLLFWAIGFGIVHIVYGMVMYYKYER